MSEPRTQRSGVSGLRVLDAEGQSTSICPAYSAALHSYLHEILAGSKDFIRR
jgi:hypothetical protein